MSDTLINFLEQCLPRVADINKMFKIFAILTKPKLSSPPYKNPTLGRNREPVQSIYIVSKLPPNQQICIPNKFLYIGFERKGTCGNPSEVYSGRILLEPQQGQ
jgi:hypothetical protein